MLSLFYGFFHTSPNSLGEVCEQFSSHVAALLVHKLWQTTNKNDLQNQKFFNGS